MREASLVRRLQQARSEATVNLDRVPNHSARNIIELHFLPFLLRVLLALRVLRGALLLGGPIRCCNAVRRLFQLVELALHPEEDQVADLRLSRLDLRQRTCLDRAKIALDFSKPFKLG